MRVVVLLFSVIAAMLGGCGSDQAEPEAASVDNTVDNTVVLRQAAAKVVGEFQQDLKSELMAAMQEGGAVNAIEVCHVRAPEIAAAHSREGVWSIVRVTDQPRRPEHMASEHQLNVMANFADSAHAEEMYTEWRTTEAGDSTFVYYQPIRIGGLCTNCHGTQDKLAEGVEAKLTGLYPQDQATGYEVGDLRGMFVVTMDWPEAKEEAEQLVGPSPGNAGEVR